jgi:hypothetical protein
LNPNNDRALDTTASIFEALGRREEAIADFSRALSVGAKHPESIAAARSAAVSASGATHTMASGSRTPITTFPRRS